jgi:hypothetical protein
MNIFRIHSKRLRGNTLSEKWRAFLLPHPSIPSSTFATLPRYNGGCQSPVITALGTFQMICTCSRIFEPARAIPGLLPIGKVGDNGRDNELGRRAAVGHFPVRPVVVPSLAVSPPIPSTICG